MTYSWHRDGGSVPSRSRGQNSNTLTITRATPPDEGRYFCMANKEGISVGSNRARVRVDGEYCCLLSDDNCCSFCKSAPFYPCIIPNLPKVSEHS